jgi:hypothetical protein
MYQGGVQLLERDADLCFRTPKLKRLAPLMSRRLAVIATLVAAAVAPGDAFAADVRLVSRDEPVAASRAPAVGTRTLAPRSAPFRFHLIGLHWRGPGTVSFRTAATRGDWSPWRPARPEAEDLPDRGTDEARARRGWVLGNPYWTRAAQRVQYRLTGGVSRLRAHFVASPPRPLRALAIPRTPGIISRAAWGANESIVRDEPSYASVVRFAVVHHTAGTNPSSPSESAAIVRGIQAYHVRSNGWDDIGYNFLVDRFGQIFEGRRGGVVRNVIGAHAQGFNTGSTGVAVLGTYENSSASTDAQSALVSLLAWRLDVAHADPLARLSWRSTGNPRYPEGTVVSLRAVSGHRDTGYTSCPGGALYSQIGDVASRAAQLGLPKLYAPAVSGVLGGPIRFTARLSEALPWTVTVADAAGAPLAQGTGFGASVDWTWNSAGVAPGAYSYRIEAGASMRPATGSLGAPFAVSELRVSPAVVTPNGDSVGDRTRISFALTAVGTATVSLADAVGNPAGTLAAERPAGAARTTIAWNGTLNGTPVPDARYRVVVTARAGVATASRFAAVVVDRTLGRLSVTPRRFSPRRAKLAIAFTLARQARVRVRVVARGRTVATVFARSAAAGRRTVLWGGRTNRGRAARGDYLAVVEATTALGTRKLARHFSIVR